MKKVIVTGGSGFIGRNLIQILLKNKFFVINIDKLTYASKNVKLKIKNKNYLFFKKDINNKIFVNSIFNKYKPDLLINVAAESHVDNSIHSSKEFINTNILGTYNLLNCSKEYLENNISKKKKFIFFQISTDEVYGDIKNGKKSLENDILNPSSPYSSSKASADLLVTSWSRTYGINYLITRSSNNYGPYQHKEKLIPVVIKSILNKKKIPIYGNGNQIREWIYVEDNVDAILKIIKSGKRNTIYNIGSNIFKKNIELVKLICKLFDQITKSKNSEKYISYVRDRKGHDKRYALNISKIKKKIKWKPKTKFRKGIKKTIEWYIKHKSVFN